jgi:hypothetical protein
MTHGIHAKKLRKEPTRNNASYRSNRIDPLFKNQHSLIDLAVDDAEPNPVASDLSNEMADDELTPRDR